MTFKVLQLYMKGALEQLRSPYQLLASGGLRLPDPHKGNRMRLAQTLVLVCSALLPLSSAWAAELVMFRRDGCPYCAAWDRDIGSGYAKSDIAKRAPLRMIDLYRDKPEFSLAQPVIYTPTFVLIDKGSEVGRIEGYPGPDFFWGLLERLIERLPSSASGVSVTRQANARVLQ